MLHQRIAIQALVVIVLGSISLFSSSQAATAETGRYANGDECWVCVWNVEMCPDQGTRDDLCEESCDALWACFGTCGAIPPECILADHAWQCC